MLYGMGDGAEKILRVFDAYGIRASGVFASDEFVRGHSFAGFKVRKLSEVQAAYGEDFVIVIAFASQRPEVLDKMYRLDARYDVFAPDVPVVGDGLLTHDYLRAREQKLRAVYRLWADEQSRRVFCNVLQYRLSGKIDFLRLCESGKAEVFSQILRPGPAEHFVDLGAYNGDTIRELLHYTDGRLAFVTALEPDARNFRKLQRYAARELGQQAALLHAGAWSEDTVLPFAARAGRSSSLGACGTVDTPVRSVDSVLGDAPCTLLKLDVEGAERQALLGAEQTIRRQAPRLNLALYHRTEDLLELPLLVHQLRPDYRLYLRHHPYVPAWDTNLYAVCP